MPRTINPTTLDHQIIRRALRVVGEYEICFSEFAATWEDFFTMKQVDFVGYVDSEITLKTARIVGSDVVHDLNTVFSESELKSFNFAINIAHRLRQAISEMDEA